MGKTGSIVSKDDIDAQAAKKELAAAGEQAGQSQSQLFVLLERIAVALEAQAGITIHTKAPSVIEEKKDVGVQVNPEAVGILKETPKDYIAIVKSMLPEDIVNKFDFVDEGPEVIFYTNSDIGRDGFAATCRAIEQVGRYVAATQGVGAHFRVQKDRLE
jgi:hypothetical protein